MSSNLRYDCVRILARQFRLKMSRVDECVFAQGNNPGKYAPKALLTVTLEDGIPDVYTYPSTSACWLKVEEKLSQAHGKPVYFESINTAVTALYEA